jgi:hypothetical protein
MPCSKNTPPGKGKCDGPYTEFACADCRKLEGTQCLNPDMKPKDAPKATDPVFAGVSVRDQIRAQNLKLKAGPTSVDTSPTKQRDPSTCKGPFSEKPCFLCKAREKSLTNPKIRDGWMTSLNLSSVSWNEASPIAGTSCVFSPAQIDRRHGQLTVGGGETKERDAGRAGRCPWIQIGNLYATVTDTGEGSWQWLVTLLQDKAPTPLVVNIFSGRHGNHEGTVIDDIRRHTLHRAYTQDPAHIPQDKLSVAKMRSELARSRTTIKLWDVGCTPGSTVNKTKRLAWECLDNGETVIFAWCYSLLSFYYADEKTVGTATYKIEHYNMPIKSIVGEKFAWAEVSALRTDAQKILNLKMMKRSYQQWKNLAAVDAKPTSSLGLI